MPAMVHHYDFSQDKDTWSLAFRQITLSSALFKTFASNSATLLNTLKFNPPN
jgi:hypothetical protein